MGWRNAKELFLTGLEIDGKEKEAIGLINNFGPTELLDDETEKRCYRLKRGALFTWECTKLFMNKAWGSNHKSGLNFVAESLGMVVSQNEYNQTVSDDLN